MAKSKTTRASEKELMDGWALHMNFFYPCRRAQNILDFQDGIKQKYTKKTFIPLKVQPVGTEVWVKIDHGDYFPAGKIQGCHGDQLLLLNKWVSKNLVIIALQEGKQVCFCLSVISVLNTRVDCYMHTIQLLTISWILLFSRFV